MIEAADHLINRHVARNPDRGNPFGLGYDLTYCRQLRTSNFRVEYSRSGA
jgi:hypothetical protein